MDDCSDQPSHHSDHSPPPYPKNVENLFFGPRSDDLPWNFGLGLDRTLSLKLTFGLLQSVIPADDILRKTPLVQTVAFLPGIQTNTPVELVEYWLFLWPSTRTHDLVS